MAGILSRFTGLQDDSPHFCRNSKTVSKQPRDRGMDLSCQLLKNIWVKGVPTWLFQFQTFMWLYRIVESSPNWNFYDSSPSHSSRVSNTASYSVQMISKQLRSWICHVFCVIFSCPLWGEGIWLNKLLRVGYYCPNTITTTTFVISKSGSCFLLLIGLTSSLGF